MSRLRILGVVGVLATTAVIAAGGAPAQAHYDRYYHGSDFASISDSHDLLKACDYESDGHAVKAQWRTWTFEIGGTGWDADGAGGDCARAVPPGDAAEFRVCENDVGCTAWRYM
ncbi:MAG TPA: hypothetical protein VGW75_13060 [Solirubrobacteraceae bacterium]|jgi:hypothetical protein|nr:hypothetical protein [Solirubrobacteraceae bacterium]